MDQLTKILYVEDQQDIQAIAKVALETIAGFTVCVCSNWQEAIEQINAFDPDLLLLDVMMPDMDGPGLLTEIRKIDRFSKVPAIFMTAKVLPSEIESLIELGALGVISKPFDPVNLGKEIQDLWQQQ